MDRHRVPPRVRFLKARGASSLPRRGVDHELIAGSRAHYEDPTYYLDAYGERTEDVEFYRALAKAHGGPVLEYGIGNGRIALPMLRAGVDVWGIDHSAAMLGDLRATVKGEPKDVQKRLRLKEGDMRKVRLGRAFPLVFCPFNTALHLYTREDVEDFLTRVRHHLAPGGRFVMDLSVPVVEDLARDPNRAYPTPKFRHPTTGDVVRYKEYFDYDRVRQVLFVSMVFEPMKDGVDAFVTPLAHRQFFPQEWETLLHYNGFTIDALAGDFEGGPLDRHSDVMVVTAKRRRGWAKR